MDDEDAWFRVWQEIETKHTRLNQAIAELAQRLEAEGELTTSRDIAARELAKALQGAWWKYDQAASKRSRERSYAEFVRSTERPSKPDNPLILQMAAGITRMETLLRSRRIKEYDAAEHASKITFADLAPREKREARAFAERNCKPTPVDMPPKLTLETFVAHICKAIEGSLRVRISFGRGNPDAGKDGEGQRKPTGPFFRVIFAAVEAYSTEQISEQTVATYIQNFRKNRPSS